VSDLLFNSKNSNCAVLMKAPWPVRIKTLKKDPQGAKRGVPKDFFTPIFFCNFKLSAQFHNPRTTPSGRKVCSAVILPEEHGNITGRVHLYLIPKIVETSFRSNACTPLGPIPALLRLIIFAFQF
jgi:hypothetical protein